jgi:hypothetical protein
MCVSKWAGGQDKQTTETAKKRLSASELAGFVTIVLLWQDLGM